MKDKNTRQGVPSPLTPLPRGEGNWIRVRYLPVHAVSKSMNFLKHRLPLALLLLIAYLSQTHAEDRVTVRTLTGAGQAIVTGKSWTGTANACG